MGSYWDKRRPAQLPLSPSLHHQDIHSSRTQFYVFLNIAFLIRVEKKPWENPKMFMDDDPPKENGSEFPRLREPNTLTISSRKILKRSENHANFHFPDDQK